MAALLVGCGEKTVDADSAAESVNGLVSKQTGFDPKDTSCPDDVEAEVGAKFECTFTGPDADYVAAVRITEIDGDDARFRIQTSPVRPAGS